MSDKEPGRSSDTFSQKQTLPLQEILTNLKDGAAFFDDNQFPEPLELMRNAYLDIVDPLIQEVKSMDSASSITEVKAGLVKYGLTDNYILGLLDNPELDIKAQLVEILKSFQSLLLDDNANYYGNEIARWATKKDPIALYLLTRIADAYPNLCWVKAGRIETIHIPISDNKIIYTTGHEGYLGMPQMLTHYFENSAADNTGCYLIRFEDLVKGICQGHLDLDAPSSALDVNLYNPAPEKIVNADRITWLSENLRFVPIKSSEDFQKLLDAMKQKSLKL